LLLFLAPQRRQILVRLTVGSGRGGQLHLAARHLSPEGSDQFVLGLLLVLGAGNLQIDLSFGSSGALKSPKVFQASSQCYGISVRGLAVTFEDSLHPLDT
jgi:hypothetical protein